jgi:hypothetical protein
MGYSRQQFYEIRRNFQIYGAEGLIAVLVTLAQLFHRHPLQLPRAKMRLDVGGGLPLTAFPYGPGKPGSLWRWCEIADPLQIGVGAPDQIEQLVRRRYVRFWRSPDMADYPSRLVYDANDPERSSGASIGPAYRP